MDINIQKLYRVYFNWKTLEESSQLRKYLRRFVKDGHEYQEIRDSFWPDMKGGTNGSTVIEVFEEGLSYIQKYQDIHPEKDS